MPKISVILPVYNVEEYIDKCIKSLLAQTLQDIEFIFVDDCSSDNSVNVIKKYTDPRIKLIQHDVNKYTAEARNTGLKNAQGEYIAFIDPDDYIENNYLEVLYNLAKENNADIVKSTFYLEAKHRDSPVNTSIQKNKFNFFFELISGLYSKKLIDKYKVQFSIDTVCFQIPIVYYANKVITTDKVRYHYITRPDSCVNSKFTPERWKKLNVAGGNLTLNFINSHIYPKESYLLMCNRIIALYQFGYARLTKEEQLLNKKYFYSLFDIMIKNLKYQDKTIINKIKGVKKKYA